jgi:dTDP-4-amino-4,6-dideoxy-D-galactose acyltransferase
VRVAQVTCPDLSDAALGAVLEKARREGIRLAYWTTHADRELPEPILRELSGRLVDRKVTFRTELIANGHTARAPGPLKILAYPKGPPSAALLALGVSAGEYSRYKLDPHVPVEKFKSLYEIWVKRSTLGELADVVLIGSLTGDIHFPAGMITVAVQGTVGVIGLIAVHETARGQGVGPSLVREAQRWMTARGLSSSTVVTQLANRPACKLYERCGYRVQDIKNVYHFWLMSEGHST